MPISTSYSPTVIQPLGKGFAVVSRFLLAFDGRNPDLPFAGEIEVALEEGRFAAQSLTIRRKADGSPITSDNMRLPVADLIRTAVLDGPLLFRVETAKGTAKLTPTDIPDLREIAQSEGATDKTLRWLAVVYRLALACGDGPTRAVMDVFGLPRGTAADWVAKARQRGHLGPTTERRASDKRERPRAKPRGEPRPLTSDELMKLRPDLFIEGGS